MMKRASNRALVLGLTWCCGILPALGALACDGGLSGGTHDTGEPEPDVAQARDILARHPVFDGHNDLAWEIRRADPPLDVDAHDLNQVTTGHTDLARLREGMVGAQFWSVYVPGEIADSGFARVQLEQIDVARRFIAKYPELELTGTADEMESAIAGGRVASLLVNGNALRVLREAETVAARFQLETGPSVRRLP